MTSSEM